MDESRLQNTPAVRILRVLADLMTANVLGILCCFPVFTIGASLSALYAVFFQRERNEGNVAVIKTFAYNFVRNFLPATILELIVLAIVGVAAGDLWFANHSEPPIRTVYYVVATILAGVGLIVFVMAFAQQSIYKNTIRNYLTNSFSLAFCAPVQLFQALASWILPIYIAVEYPEIAISKLGVVYLICGLSFPIWMTAKVLNPVFEKAGKTESDSQTAQN